MIPMTTTTPARKGWRKEILAGIVILAGLFIAWHVIPALGSKDSPPAACSIAGGQWNAWSGWNC